MKKLRHSSLHFGSALFCAGLALAALIVSPAGADAQTSYVYIESNNGKPGGLNSVYGFSNDGSGNLSMLPGSPFATGGVGVIDPGNSGTDPFDADQQIITNAAGTLLFAVNGHSNDISAFSIGSDGSLSAVSGSPFPSGGPNPASVGLLEAGSGNILVVVNKNEDFHQDIASDVPNLTTFTVNADGSLSMIPGSTLDRGADCSPSKALIRNRGRLLFDQEVNTSRLVSYKVGRDGLLTEIDSEAPPSESPFLGEILSPVANVLYAGLPGTNEVAVYRFNKAGNMIFETKVPNASGSLVCWLAINQAGTRLYTAETASGTISVFDTTDPLSPVLLQTHTLSGTEQHPHNIVLDPSGQFLYAQSLNLLHVMNVNGDGTLSQPIAPVVLPQPVTQIAIGLAVVRK